MTINFISALSHKYSFYQRQSFSGILGVWWRYYPLSYPCLPELSWWRRVVYTGTEKNMGQYWFTYLTVHLTHAQYLVPVCVCVCVCVHVCVYFVHVCIIIWRQPSHYITLCTLVLYTMLKKICSHLYNYNKLKKKYYTVLIMKLYRDSSLWVK